MDEDEAEAANQNLVRSERVETSLPSTSTMPFPCDSDFVDRDEGRQLDQQGFSPPTRVVLAEKLREQVVMMRKVVLGEQHSYTLTSIDIVARYRSRGRARLPASPASKATSSEWERCSPNVALLDGAATGASGHARVPRSSPRWERRLLRCLRQDCFLPYRVGSSFTPTAHGVLHGSDRSYASTGARGR
nr:hypothetical protein CFP56_02897 [Quercus suber]